MNVPTRAPHTAALLAALEDSGVPVGDGEKPDAAGWQGAPGTSTFQGYLVLHSIPGGELDGSLGEPIEATDWPWQFTAVGDTRALCETIADLARQALYAAPISLDDRAQRWLRPESTGGAARDESIEPLVFIAVEVFRWATTPSPTGS